MAAVTAVVIGAGNRGLMYASYALDFPEKFKIVGVAEPDNFRRNKLKELHSVEDERTFRSWSEVASVEKFADCALITTQDQLHAEPAVALAKKGYHILLEKPMAVSYADCCEIVSTCRSCNVILAVCYVLRYLPEVHKIAELVRSGALGEIVCIQHTEPVGYWHFAHSYVRGNWRNSKSSTFSLLAKSCHDLDLIQMWMGDKRCLSVSSFGSLKHFKPQCKPSGASSRCVDCGVEATCPYSAKKIYLGFLSRGCTGWPVDVLTDTPDIESITERLHTGPYGRCVYDCDNDVVDNQVVMLEYEGGATVSFTMIGCSEPVLNRSTKIFGTRAELTCSYDGDVKVYDFLQDKHIVHNAKSNFHVISTPSISSHSGADFFTIDSFVQAVATGDASRILTGPEESLCSHLLCFAAEKSRVERRVVDLTLEQIV